MTDRLSDERLREIAGRLRRRAEQAMGQLHCGSENWEYREAHKEADLNHDSVAALVELLDLRAENARLRERCTWLQERRAVLRKLLAAKWSKRKEVRAMRAKLAAGPVMPEEPSKGALSTAAVVFLPRFGPRGVYGAIRDALLAEQRDVE